MRRRVLAGHVVVGRAATPVDVASFDAASYDVLLTDESDPPRPWVHASVDAVEVGVEHAPDAAAALVQVLRANERVGVPEGLAVESMAYSMLQHGGVFTRWLATRERRAARRGAVEPVHLSRVDDRLDVILQRPHVHNAFDAATRDALCDAFDLVALDPTVTEVHLHGDGPSFCSGGDLDEFGTARDASAAHLLRLDRSVGRRIHDHADRVVAHLHGACIGAGIELAAFAGRVHAAPDTRIALPELAMGLVPGAGGTVSIPRRIGRHRTAYLALTGAAIGPDVAHAWGLVDVVDAQLYRPRRHAHRPRR